MSFAFSLLGRTLKQCSFQTVYVLSSPVCFPLHNLSLSIADAIGVHVSTIYRELSRNSNKRGGYAHNAHEMAMDRQNRVVKNATISMRTKFECLQHIRVDLWSPEQISGYLKLKGISVSHTTIYKWVKEDKEAGGNLFEFLRHKGRKRNPTLINAPLPETSLTGHLLKTGLRKPTENVSATGKWIS